MLESQYMPYTIPMAVPETSLPTDQNILSKGLSQLSELSKATTRVFDKMASIISPNSGLPRDARPYLPQLSTSLGNMNVPVLDAIAPRLDKKPERMLASEWLYNAPLYGQQKKNLLAGDIAATAAAFTTGVPGLIGSIAWGLLSRPISNWAFQDTEVQSFRQAATMYQPVSSRHMVSPEEVLSGNTFQLSQAQRNYNFIRRVGKGEKLVTKDEYDEILKNLMTSGMIDLTMSDMKELRDRVKSNIKAVKEISEILRMTLDDSVKALGELKRAGIVGPGANTTAMLTRAVAMQTGMPIESLLQLGVSANSALVQAGAPAGQGFEFSNQLVSATFESYKDPQMTALMDTMGGPDSTSARIMSLATNLMNSPQGVMLLGMSSPTSTGVAPNPMLVSQAVAGNLPYSQLASRAGLVSAETGITNSYGAISDLTKNGKNTNELLFMIAGLLKSLVTEYSQYTKSEAAAIAMAGSAVGMSPTDVSLILKTITPEIVTKVQEQQFGAVIAGLANEQMMLAQNSKRGFFESIWETLFPPERETFSDRIRQNIAYDREVAEQRQAAVLRGQLSSVGFTELSYGPIETYKDIDLPMQVRLGLLASSIPGASVRSFTPADLNATLMQYSGVSQEHDMGAYSFPTRNTAVLDTIRALESRPDLSASERATLVSLKDSASRLSTAQAIDVPLPIQGVIGELSYSHPETAKRLFEYQRGLLTVPEQYTKLPDTTVIGGPTAQARDRVEEPTVSRKVTISRFRDEAEKLKTRIRDDVSLTEDQRTAKLRLIDSFFSAPNIQNTYRDSPVNIDTERGFRTAVSELSAQALNDNTKLFLYKDETDKIKYLQNKGIEVYDYEPGGPETLVYVNAGDLSADAVSMFDPYSDVGRMWKNAQMGLNSLANSVAAFFVGPFSSQEYAKRKELAANYNALAEVMSFSRGIVTQEKLGAYGVTQAGVIPEVPFASIKSEDYAKAMASDAYQTVVDMAFSTIMSGLPETNVQLKKNVASSLETAFNTQWTTKYTEVPRDVLASQLLGLTFSMGKETAPILGRVATYGYTDERNPYLNTAGYIATEVPDRFKLAAAGLAGGIWEQLSQDYLDEEGGIVPGAIRGAVSKTAGMTFAQAVGLPEKLAEIDFQSDRAISILPPKDVVNLVRNWNPTDQQRAILATFGDIPVLGQPAVVEGQQLADKHFGGDLMKGLAAMYYQRDLYPQFATQVDVALGYAKTAVQGTLSNVSPYKHMTPAQIQNQITDLSAKVIDNVQKTRMIALAAHPDFTTNMWIGDVTTANKKIGDMAASIGVSSAELRDFMKTPEWRAISDAPASVQANIVEGLSAIQTAEPEIVSRLYTPFVQTYNKLGTFEQYQAERPGATFTEYAQAIAKDYSSQMNLSRYEANFLTSGMVIPLTDPQAQVANQGIFITRSMLANEALQAAKGDREVAREMYETVLGPGTFDAYVAAGGYVEDSLELARSLTALQKVQTFGSAQTLLEQINTNPKLRMALELKYGEGLTTSLDQLGAFLDKAQLPLAETPEGLEAYGKQLSELMKDISGSVGGTAGAQVKKIQRGYDVGVSLAMAAFEGDTVAIKEILEGDQAEHLRGLYGSENFELLSKAVSDITASEDISPEDKQQQIYELVTSGLLAAVPSALLGDTSKYSVLDEKGATAYLDYMLQRQMPSITDSTLTEIVSELKSGSTSELVPTMEKLITTLEALAESLPSSLSTSSDKESSKDLSGVHNTLKDIVAAQEQLSGNLVILETLVHQDLIRR